MIRSVWRIAGLAVLITGGAAQARELLRPAETPPASFGGQQYVDSKGCLFLRAGTATDVVWIPRVTRQGGAVCGYPPSGRRVAIEGEAGVSAPVSKPVPAAEPAVVDPAAAVTGLLVAVGSFSVTANADRAAQNMADLGLPVVRGEIVQSGIALSSVFAGPFDTPAAAAAALQLVRGAGFPDALILGQ